jgi:hypothetical protein
MSALVTLMSFIQLIFTRRDDLLLFAGAWLWSMLVFHQEVSSGSPSSWILKYWWIANYLLDTVKLNWLFYGKEPLWFEYGVTINWVMTCSLAATATLGTPTHHKEDVYEYDTVRKFYDCCIHKVQRTHFFIEPF